MGTSSDHPFFGLGDDEIGALATSAPRRVPRAGKADLGGRMRVASILRSAGIAAHDMPERIAGSTNEVWRAGDHVVRVSFAKGSERLRREGRLASILPKEVPYPKVVASGAEPFGEWIIVRRRQGKVLSEEWPRLTVAERRSAVRDVAEVLKAVHRAELDAGDIETLRFPEASETSGGRRELRPSALLGMIEEARGEPYADQGLLNDVERRVGELTGTIPEGERHGLIHGDLHFENILVHEGVLVAMFDFEWARLAPLEIDIDVLARFCAEPHLHVGGDYRADAADYRDVLRWMAESYPELFSHPRVTDRLTLCALGFDVPSLLAMPPTAPASQLSPHHPLNRLRSLLDHGTHAERLGWDLGSGDR